MSLTETTTLIATEPIMVLAIGPWDRGEFAIALDEIQVGEKWLAVSDCETASELLNQSQYLTEFILLAQPLPGSYQQSEIERLRRAAPLAQIVLVAGSWCEGELRTGKPLAGVLRLYWYELPPWWLTIRKDPLCWSPCLDSPLSPRSSETFFDQKLEGVAAIQTPTHATYETLAATLAPYGLKCHWTRRDSKLPDELAVGIWDGGQLDPPELAELQIFATAIHKRGGSPIVLLDFPRKEHFSQLRKINCTAILGKPYITTELLNVIHRLRFRDTTSPVL